MGWEPIEDANSPSKFVIEDPVAGPIRQAYLRRIYEKKKLYLYT